MPKPQSQPPTLKQLKGAIFDVDDTLLDNHPGGAAHGLHERSRLAAIREAGRRHHIPELEHFSEQANLRVFLDAKVHSIEGAVWQTFLVTGLQTNPDLDPTNPLVQEIVALKNDYHEDVLREHGRSVPGTLEFIQTLVRAGLGDKLAIASTAFRRDIDIFLETSGLAGYFPPARIISRERFSHFKPHPEAFNAAFATLGLPEAARSRVLAVEDDPRGIMSAKAAGLFTAAITTRHSATSLRGLTVPPDLIAGGYADLRRVLTEPAL
jgi:beta-phosphoglucomutase-like phosphatase (HAD superfamily)